MPHPYKYRKAKTWFFLIEWRIIFNPYVPNIFFEVDEVPEDKSKDTSV